jgi:hypothetical protein
MPKHTHTHTSCIDSIFRKRLLESAVIVGVPDNPYASTSSYLVMLSSCIVSHSSGTDVSKASWCSQRSSCKELPNLSIDDVPRTSILMEMSSCHTEYCSLMMFRKLYYYQFHNCFPWNCPIHQCQSLSHWPFQFYMAIHLMIYFR